MSTALSKRAFVRGMNHTLISEGALSYPTKEAADYTADFVADRLEFPDPYTQGDHLDLKVAHTIGLHLIKSAAEVTKHLGGSTRFNKQASSLTPEQTAVNDSYSLLEKIAAEGEANTLANAAQTNEQAAADLARRPEGYAMIPVGAISDMGVGAVGVERPADTATRVEGSNSVVEASKMAGISAWLKGAGVENTLAAAAKTDEPAAMDNSQRPAGYAQVPVGTTKLNPSGSAIIGSESSVAPSNSPSGSNSVTVLKTAALAAPFFNPAIPEMAKTAHVTAMSKLSSAKAQGKYLERMYLGYGVDKVAAAKVCTDFIAMAKKAEDECDDDMEVARAMNEAAEELEGKAADKAGGDPHKPDGMPSEAKDKEDNDVKEAALREAAARVAKASGLR